MKFSRFVLLFVACALATALSAKTIYVAPGGNDSSTTPTDPTTPFKTVDKAFTTATADDTVDTIHIAAGTYAEKKGWTISKRLVVEGEGSSLTILKTAKIRLNHAEAEVRDLRLTGYDSQGALTLGQQTGGAAGTARRCDISGNTRTTTAGTGVYMYGGSLIDCTITNNVNSGGKGDGIGVYVSAEEDCLIEGCLIADNDTGGTSGSGGLYIGGTAEKAVTVRHCTIVGNKGGTTGGLNLGGTDIRYAKVHIVIEDCLVGDNIKLADPTASNTEDAYLGWVSGYTRTLRNCLIAKCPTYNAGYVVENCIFGVSPGFVNSFAGDYRIGRQSAAWGAASDGTDIGWQQTAHGDTLSVGCYAVTNRGLVPFTVTLVGTCVNAVGDVTYEWDLDGDGTYEATGATVEATFTTLGFNSVRVKATCGGASDAATVENVAYVCPKTMYVWTESPNPAFPYATWETAAHVPDDALAMLVSGGTLQFTNELVELSKVLKVYRPIEMRGTGRENNSVVSKPRYFNPTIPYVDEHAKGTSIQCRRNGSTSLVKVFASGAFVHSIAFGPGDGRNLAIYGDSIVSNCTVRYGHYTSSDAPGLLMTAGLATHCVISNNYGQTGNICGCQVNLSGTAKLRNSLVINGRGDGLKSGVGCLGAVYADGANVQIENCTICGNVAGQGGGIYATGAAQVRNCIVRDNSALYDSNSNDIFDKAGKMVVENCCLKGEKGTGCQTEDPGFILDPVTGLNTWTFSTASCCANTGKNLNWTTEDATDLFGNSRVQGEIVDIGCFEADMSQATCDIKAEPNKPTGPTNVVFSAVITGKTLSDEAEYLWDFDGDGMFEKSGATVTNACGEGVCAAILKVTDQEVEVFNVTNEAAVTVYPLVLYFDSANAAGERFPYNTPQTAASTMAAAFKATSVGCELRIVGGSHPCNAQIAVTKRMTVCAVPGLESRPRLVRSGAAGALVMLGDADAVVEGLEFDNVAASTPEYIMISAGTFRDCVISNASYTSAVGIGLRMTGGLADRCEIVNIRGGERTGTDAGFAVCLSGSSVLRNSLLRNLKCRSATNGREGGAIAVRDDAVMENCTITDIANPEYEAVALVGGGTVRNCIITDCACGSRPLHATSLQWPSILPCTAAMAYDATAPKFLDYNCYTSATQTAVGEHDVVTGDPRFRAPARGDYTVRTVSPAYRTGLVLDWMEEDGALDFLGRPRLWGGKVDMGAFQCQCGSGMMLMVW